MTESLYKFADGKRLEVKRPLRIRFFSAKPVQVPPEGGEVLITWLVEQADRVEIIYNKYVERQAIIQGQSHQAGGIKRFVKPGPLVLLITQTGDDVADIVTSQQIDITELLEVSSLRTSQENEQPELHPDLQRIRVDHPNGKDYSYLVVPKEGRDAPEFYQGQIKSTEPGTCPNTDCSGATATGWKAPITGLDPKLDKRIQEFIENEGMSPQEAYTAFLQKTGGYVHTCEECKTSYFVPAAVAQLHPETVAALEATN